MAYSPNVIFDPVRLRILSDLARTSSFTDTADRMGLSQSQVSAAIARLEQDLGRQLFNRTTRSVQVTPDGQALLVYAEAMSDLMEDARRHFDRPSLSGVIKIGLVEDFATAGLPSVLSIFRKAYPTFGIVFRTGLSSTISGLLDRGAIDLALTKRLSGSDGGKLLGTSDLVWVGGTGSEDHPDQPIPIVTYPEPSETRTRIVEACRSARRSWSIVVESDGITGQVSAVRAGLGFAAFSEGLLPDGLVASTLHHLPSLDPLDYVMALRPYPHSSELLAFSDALSGMAAVLLRRPAPDTRAG